MAVFDRIVVDIIQMARVINIVSDGVLPKAPLPDATLASGHTNRRASLGWLQRSRETDFHRLDPVGEVVIESKVVHRAELRRGVIEVYHGWEDWRINFTTYDHINDPISGFPLLKGVPVFLEKIAT